MLDDKTLKRLVADRTRWPNVIAPPRQPWQDGERRLWVDTCLCRSLAQGLIDTLDDHVHLREARLCVLLRTGLKANADGLLELGRASKAAPRDRVGFEGADFLVEINADAWAERPGETEAEMGRRRLALLDHELMHCGVTIAGSWVPPTALASFVEDLGGDHVETTDEVDGRGRTLVRYRKRRGPLKCGADDYHGQPLAWRCRKHDAQDFTDVVARWGPWEPGVRRLYDELVNVDWDQQLADWPETPLGKAAGGGDGKKANDAACPERAARVEGERPGEEDAA